MLRTLLCCALLAGCASGDATGDVGMRFFDAEVDAGTDAGVDAMTDAPMVDAPTDVAPDTILPDAGSICGGDRETCCVGDECSGILVCHDGFCATCGRTGEPCCDGGGCNAGLTCIDGECGGCGGLGETCCPGTPCEAAMVCVGGSCRACGDEPGTCVPGTMDTASCGRCGVQTRVCNAACAWGDFTSCIGEGACTAGETETRNCGLCGTQTRACDATCNWEAYDDCSGEGTCMPGDPVVGACEGTCQAQSCDAMCTATGACTAPSPTCSTLSEACNQPCRAGWHHVNAECDPACGTCMTGWVNHATRCDPDSGASFWSCLICNATTCYVCGDGYHIGRIQNQTAGTETNCGTSPPTVMRCDINTPMFDACGDTCPTGYTRTSVLSMNDTVNCQGGWRIRCTGPGT